MKTTTKKEAIIQQITNFESKYFNQDQKDIMIEIIKNAPFNKEQEYFDFLKMKRRTGFSFDYSPEVAKGRIITLRENIDKRINVDQKVEDNENKLIIGDNYNALKSLLITHKEKIDVIYIDPPYNTESAKDDGNQSYKSGSASKFNYKDKFGRGGWLNMMKQRLDLAKDLLTDEGVVFVSINDQNQAYLKVLMDDIFGEENFICNFDWISKPGGQSDNKYISTTKQYILTYKKTDCFQIYKKYIKIHEHQIYGKDKNVKFLKSTELNNPAGEDGKFAWQRINLSYHVYYNPETNNILFSPSWDIKKEKPISPLQKEGYYVASPKKPNLRWRWSQAQIIKKRSNLIFEIKNNKLRIFKKQYVSELGKKTFIKDDLIRGITQTSGTIELKSIMDQNAFPYPKPSLLIKNLIKLQKDKNSIVLDFFAGSGTTGHAVMELNREDSGNRKFILCTNNENNIADEVTYERLHRIIKGCGTNGETNFKWLEKNKPFDDTKLRVINIDDNVSITPNQIDIDQIINNCQKGLKLLDNSYNKSEIELYYDLAAMNPLENEK